MKKTIAIILAACFLLALGGCGQEPATETRYLIETQLYESPAFSETVRKTVFTYREDYSTESMTVYEGDVEVGRTTVELDENGMLWKQTTYENGEVTETMEYRYVLNEDGDPTQVDQYQNGVHYATSTRTYTNGVLTGNSTTFHLTELTTTYTYDAMGNILTSIMESGGNTFTTAYTYDENGNELTCVTQDASGIRTTVTEYADGKKVRSTETLEDGTRSAYSEYTYEALVETVTSYSGDGTCYGSTVRTTDEHGNTLTLESYDAAGNLQFRQSYTYIAAEVPVA